MKLTTTTRHPFGGGFRSPGDTFEATADEARVYADLGWATAGGAKPEAKPATPAKKATKQAKPAKGYNTRALKARK